MTNEELRKILVDNSDIADEILLRINTSGKQLSDISVNEALGNINAVNDNADNGYSFGTLSGDDIEEISSSANDKTQDFASRPAPRCASRDVFNDDSEPKQKNGWDAEDNSGGFRDMEQQDGWDAKNNTSGGFSDVEYDEFGNARRSKRDDRNNAFRSQYDEIGNAYKPSGGSQYGQVLPRQELKALAKGHMKEQYGALLKNLLVLYAVAFGMGLISSIVSIFSASAADSNNTILTIILGIVGLAVTIGSVIVSCGMQFGYTKGFLNARRGERVESLFSYFDRWGNIFKLTIMLILKIAWPIFATIGLWLVLIIIAGITKSGAIVVIAALPFIAAVIYAIYKSFCYALAMNLYVDDGSDITFKDASEILEKSKELMNGYKFDYFVIGLSFIGWLLVMSLAYYVPTIIFSIIIAAKGGAVSIFAFLLAMLILVVLMFILMLPLMIYMQMTFIEFYDSRCGRDARPVSAERNLIRMPLIALIVSCVLVAVSAFIPGPSMMGNQFGSLLDNNGLPNNSGYDQPSIDFDNDDQNIGSDSGDSIFDNNGDNTGDNSGFGQDSNSGNNSGIVPPAGYTVSYDDGITTTFYTEDASNSITVIRNSYAYDDEFVTSVRSGAIHDTMGGKNGWFYVDGDASYTIYGFIFNKGDNNSVEVTVTDIDVLDQIVQQL